MRRKGKIQTITIGREPQGSAAIEVLLLMVFIILPLFVLLFNMGYHGIRMRQAQNALRLGAFDFTGRLVSEDTEAARKSAQNIVNSTLFKNEIKAAKLSVSGQDNPPDDLPKVDGLFAQASFRHAIGIEVSRTPPYDVFSNTPIKRSLIVASNTFTYCEFQDKLFSNSDSKALKVLSFLGKTGLKPFGWIPDGDDVCK